MGAWDKVITGDEETHQQYHDAIHALGEAMAIDPDVDPATGTPTFHPLTKFTLLSDTGDGQLKVPAASLGVGVPSATSLLGNRKHVATPLQYRDLEVNGVLQVTDSVKRFLWEEAVNLVALRLRLDGAPNGDVVLDLTRSGTSLLGAGKITFGSGVQVVRVVPTTTAIAAGDQLRLHVLTPLPGTPGSNLSGCIAYRPVLNQAA